MNINEGFFIEIKFLQVVEFQNSYLKRRGMLNLKWDRSRDRLRLTQS